MNCFWIFWLNGLGPHGAGDHMGPTPQVAARRQRRLQHQGGLGVSGGRGWTIRKPKKAQKLQKNWKIVFFTKTVFFTIQVDIWEVWGCPGGGHGPYEEMSRTLAGFGLTGHGGSRFSCFLDILETHFITKYLQICPRARLVLGFCFCQGPISGDIK